MTKLRNLRLDSGLSQSQFAEKAGANVRMIQHYEQGQKSIDKVQVGTLLRYAVALGCSLADLFETEEMVELARRYDEQRRSGN